MGRLGNGVEIMNRLERVPMPVQAATPTLPPPQENAPSSFMVCSLPPIAASLDQFQRQFYNRSNVPQYRILPPNL